MRAGSSASSRSFFVLFVGVAAYFACSAAAQEDDDLFPAPTGRLSWHHRPNLYSKNVHEDFRRKSLD